jgi:hypothetical protein
LFSLTLACINITFQNKPDMKCRTIITTHYSYNKSPYNPSNANAKPQIRIRVQHRKTRLA